MSWLSPKLCPIVTLSSYPPSLSSSCQTYSDLHSLARPVHISTLTLLRHIFKRPLSRVLARASYQLPICCGGSPAVDRVVISLPFCLTIRQEYWWSAQSSKGLTQEEVTEQENSEDELDFSPIANFRRVQRQSINVPRRIYILGVGNIGGFVAHSLAGLPHRPPITLLLPRARSMANWEDQGKSIKLTTNGMLDTKYGFDVEIVRPFPVTQHGESNQSTSQMTLNGLVPLKSTNTPEIIHNLILSLKAGDSVSALKCIAHRLTAESCIVFLQNGMGIVDEINERVFPDSTTRPQYMLGVISHGVYHTGRFSLVHAGLGTTALTILPRDIHQVKPEFEPSALYLLRTMTRTPVLAAVGFGPTDLLQLQIEKLAINAIINPLTALLGCSNGDLLYRPSISRVIRLLLAEISLVIKSLPELQGVPNVNTRFDIRRLEALVIRAAGATAANTSSTLQDIRRGRKTEIKYITGYLIRRGEELGIQCVLNYMLFHMIKTKERMEGEKHGNLLPLEPRASV